MEVLLAMMYRIQNCEMNSEVAEIASKHKESLRLLEEEYEQSIEEAKLKAHSNIEKRRNYEEEEEVESELYEDFDEKSYGENSVGNPYKDGDAPVRRPKILDVNGFQAHRNP